MTLIAPSDAQDFLKLYIQLMHYAGRARGVIAADMSGPDFMATDLETKAECRDAIYDPEPLLEEFIHDAGDMLDDTQRTDLRGFARHVSGQFVIVEHLPEHSILMTSSDPATFYAVHSLTTDLAEMLPEPMVIGAVLLPYRGVVLCDGLVTGSVMVGPNMEAEFKERYAEAKANDTIVTAL